MSLQKEQERKMQEEDMCNESMYSQSRVDEDGMVLTTILDTFATPEGR